MYKTVRVKDTTNWNTIQTLYKIIHFLAANVFNRHSINRYFMSSFHTAHIFFFFIIQNAILYFEKYMTSHVTDCIKVGNVSFVAKLISMVVDFLNFRFKNFNKNELQDFSYFWAEWKID